MSIAIVVPAYNAETYLDTTLRSVLAQTASDWRLVLVDDGSTDGTGQIAARWAADDDRIRVVTTANRGLSAARNGGLKHVAEDAAFVLFLDADDLLEPTALQTLREALTANPLAPATHGRVRVIDPSGEPAGMGFDRMSFENGRPVVATDDRATTFEMLVAQNPIMTAGSVLIRRSAIDAVGAFDEAFNGVADWDFWLRLARIAPIAFVPQVTLAYRRHPTSMSANVRRMRRDAARMRKTWLLKSTPSERRSFISGYTALCRHYARRQIAQVWDMTKQRQWGVLRANVIKTAWVLTKALPGVPRLTMTLGAKF